MRWKTVRPSPRRDLCTSATDGSIDRQRAGAAHLRLAAARDLPPDGSPARLLSGARRARGIGSAGAAPPRAGFQSITRPPCRRRSRRSPIRRGRAPALRRDVACAGPGARAGAQDPRRSGLRGRRGGPAAPGTSEAAPARSLPFRSEGIAAARLTQPVASVEAALCLPAARVAPPLIRSFQSEEDLGFRRCAGMRLRQQRQ